MTNIEDIGSRLKELRGSKTQAEFAQKIGIALLTYQRYERGERFPRGDVLYRIALSCRVSSDWILYGKKKLSLGETKKDLIGRSKVQGRELTIEDEEQEERSYLKEKIKDVISIKIVDLLSEMDLRSKREILKYIEEKKQLKDFLSKKMQANK